VLRDHCKQATENPSDAFWQQSRATKAQSAVTEHDKQQACAISPATAWCDCKTHYNMQLNAKEPSKYMQVLAESQRIKLTMCYKHPCSPSYAREQSC
jgi:hypothetical protein